MTYSPAPAICTEGHLGAGSGPDPASAELADSRDGRLPARPERSGARDHLRQQGADSESRRRHTLPGRHRSRVCRTPATVRVSYWCDEQRIVLLLSGKSTGDLGVESRQGANREELRMTGLERTLSDIAVRPTYAYGIYQVL